MKVILQVRDGNFSAMIRGLFEEVTVMGEDESLETVGREFNGRELLFLDRIPLNGFYNVNARVIVVAPGFSQRKEFMAARAGARGFISSDIAEPQLLKVIGSIAAGEYWMSRATIARVFEEYTRECYRAEREPNTHPRDRKRKKAFT